MDDGGRTDQASRFAVLDPILLDRSERGNAVRFYSVRIRSNSASASIMSDDDTPAHRHEAQPCHEVRFPFRSFRYCVIWCLAVLHRNVPFP